MQQREAHVYVCGERMAWDEESAANHVQVGPGDLSGPSVVPTPLESPPVHQNAAAATDALCWGSARKRIKADNTAAGLVWTGLDAPGPEATAQSNFGYLDRLFSTLAQPIGWPCWFKSGQWHSFEWSMQALDSVPSLSFRLSVVGWFVGCKQHEEQEQQQEEGDDKSPITAK
ncbi:hypothetical protein AXG93_1923s1650 [Marchantia polymorpha subsp. ruderalis]|uniref:Uncharacterized protein n=1 Tax=Marchantia polymorpha subsp. ruderalis TaxID=1480154 RepID=A0A176VCG8_MARPO|nr:hypothetical protein AXG93_1923s1650 [Marchantia polymorpha subsp. ruderalis]